MIILTNLYRRGKIKDGDIMNILKHISIKGEIFCEYAFLNFDFEFEHDMLDRISTEYIFRLPSGALISSVKVLSGTEFVPAKSTTVSHASKVIDLGMPAAQLRRVDNNLYSMNLSGISKGSCHILITAYAELKDVSGKKRLNIPLCDDCFADIDININQNVRCFSPTHNIDIDKSINTRILAERDFCLEFSNFEQKNAAIATNNTFGGQMLIRAYPETSLKKQFKKAIFIYYPDLFGAVARCAKEFILYASDHFEEVTLLWADGISKGKDKLLDALSGITYGGEIELNKIAFDKETLPIIVSETPVTDDRFFNVTVGDNEGENHIFARDNIQDRTAEIINSLSIRKDVWVSSDNGDVEIVSVTDNSVTVYVSYRGAMPKSIIIDGERISFNNIEVYRSFAPVQLVCGDLYTKREEKRLLSAKAEEIINIRRNLEQIGVKYSVLNSESALLATLSRAKVASIRVAMPPRIKKAYSAFDERYSMFNETESVKGKALATSALDIILRSMRADGAICADGEINDETRKKQTLICLLALIYAEFENRTYIKYATDFIKDYQFSGISFTTDRIRAKAFLDEFFSGKNVETIAFVPDLITSANIIRLFW